MAEVAAARKAEYKAHLANDVIAQMMFVSGETIEPSPETTTLVEQLVQDQVQAMVSITDRVWKL